MKNHSAHIVNDDLLIKYLQKQTNEDQSSEIELWLSDSPDNQSRFNNVKKIWEHSSLISDFDLIDTVGDWQIVQSKMGTGNVIKTKSINLKLYTVARIAAVVLVAFGIFFLMKYFMGNKSEMLIYATGQDQLELLLSDSSKVYLNQYSELSYPDRFSKKERTVKLRGEAFFEVSRNEKKSFIVLTSNQGTIEVLGTSFNIKEDTSSIIVHVTSGKVAFYQTDDSDQQTILTKNQKAILKNETIVVSNSHDPNFLSWKTGILEFKNIPLAKAVEQLTDYYKQPIKIDNQSIGEYKYTSTINNQPLEEVIDEIKLVFNLESILKNDTIIIFPNQ
jgi:ferric-dicitrate binding protein FerR (iron transport regulator)